MTAAPVLVAPRADGDEQPPPAERPAAARAPSVLAHLAPALVAALTTASWFRPGEFFARGDIPPFERRAPLAEVLSLWGHQFSPAGGPSYLLARLPELAAGALGDWTGVGPEAAQRLFFAAVAGAVAGAAAYFASALVRRPAAIAAVGLLAFFNPLTLQRLPNVLTLWAVLTMALVGGVVLRAAAGAAMRPVALGLASLPSCYLALNPPLLVVAIGWVPLLLVVAALGWGRPGLRRASGLVARSTPWVVILNLWWAVPFALVLASARASSALGAETSVSSWSWTHAASSLGNVVTLSGSWAWRSPDYFPYAAALDRPPSGTLKLGLPLLAASGVLLARPARRVVLALAAVAVPLVLLGKGLHPPLAGVNRFLYDHVPAMYLLREPLGKVGPPLLLLLLGMGALALEHAGRGVGGRIEARRWAVAVPVVLALAGLAYPRPLWTGEVVVAASGRLPPASVELPEDWRAVGRHLDASGRHGKVLVLPLDDFYQMPTTWGFYGADVIPRWLTGRTTIQPLPESYLADPEAHRRLVDRAQAALLARDLDEVPRVLRALGASEVVLRKDLDTGFPDRRIVDHRDLSPALERTPGLSRTLANDVATVYRVDDGDRPVYLADGVIGAVDEERDTADLVAASPHRGAVVRPGSGRTGHVLRPPAREVSFETGGGPHILDKGLVEGSIVEMAPAADGAALEIRDVAPVVLDGRPALAAPEGRVALPEGSEPAAVVGQRLVRIPGPPARAVMRTGDHVATFDLGDRSRAGTELSPVQDCHARDRLSLSEAGIEAAPIAEHGPAVLLRARAHAACVSLALPQAATSPAVHRVTLEYRTVSGRPARLCLFEIGPDRCHPLPSLDPAPEWQRYDQVAVAGPGTRSAALFLYADGDAADGATTVTEYRSVVASTHDEHGRWTMPVQPAATVELAAGRHTLGVVDPGPADPGEPSGLSEVADCHAFDGRSPAEVGIGATTLDADGPRPALRLTAREHRACVTLPARGTAPDMRYGVSFEYRNVRGRPASVCLYQAGPGRCAALPAPEPGPGWRRYRAVATPDAGTEELRLYLYADGATGDPGRGPATTVDYRDVRVAGVSPFDVALVPAGRQEAGAADLAWRRTGRSSYRIAVPASGDERMVVLTEAFSRDWRAAAPPGVDVDHIRANGWANAWVLPAGPAATLEVGYGPDRWAVPLVVVSASALAVAIAVAGAARPRRARSRARPGRSGSPAP